MSFLSRGPGNSPNGVNPERIEMAVTELDTVTDFFNRMVSSCHAKCISTRYSEADLNKGESVCIDRCVAKFNEVQKKVGEKLQNRGAAAANGGGAGGFAGL
ncbi:hypothetical protein ONZ45_g9594 [Pleurotus djamor]|nr:hypothetical protein ONZ45_g10105 [Pleurotus djamor]KAJ8508099.1 hypothetical protein ONZ45_g9594 [Pleurotus djamor]